MTFGKYKKNSAPAPHSVWTNPIHFIACGFGFGTFPYFPGTIGTAIAIPLAIGLSRTPAWFYLAACIVLFFIGVYVCGVVNRDFGTDDHPAAVFDEFATFPISFFLIPISWKILLIGFLVFRFFDIVKPYPISWVDRHIHGGWGVMLDDLLAAIFTWIVLHAILILI